MSAKTYNILFCGIGGQGVLKSSEILGWAALYSGYHVRKSEVHGMSQRGGSVESHLRFGENVPSPLIPEGAVDYLVAFFKDERERMSGLLAPGGVDLFPAMGKAESLVANKKYRNTYVLGALSVLLPIPEANWIRAIQKVVPEFASDNEAVFRQGREGAL